ncbi:MAG: TolC family protein [Bacteroidia bacterium]
MLNRKTPYAVRMIFISCAVNFSLSFIPTGVSAQTKVITLTDALQSAEKNYPLLKAKDWNVKAATEQLTSVKEEALMPSLKLSEQANYATSNAVQGTYFPFGGVISTSGGIGANNSYDPVYGSYSLASFEWVPFSFGQNKSKIELSKIELENTMLDAENTKFQQSVKVIDAYLILVAFHQLNSVTATNFQRAKAIKIATTALVKSGLRPGVDSSFANSELSKATLDLNESQKNELTQKIVLANLIGEESTNFTIDTVTFLTKDPTIPIDTNFSSLPLLKLYNSKIEFGNEKQKYILRSYFPKISILSAAWGRGSGMGIAAGSVSDASFSGAKLSRYNYAIGVACTFNILDFPRMHSQLLSEKALTSSYMEEYNQFTLDTRTRIAAANEQIDFAKKQQHEVPVQYDAAINAFNQSKARYESGLATLTDVSQSLYILNRASADKVIANNNVWRAFLQKAASTGNISEFLNQLK